MKSKKRGRNTSKVEVQNISRHGIWLFVQSKEYFLSFKNYPWFKGASVSEILDVSLLHGHHLYWSELDVDLKLASLENPDCYPLVYQT